MGVVSIDRAKASNKISELAKLKYAPREKTGSCSVRSFSTLAARVRRSPDSPTQMLRTSFSILISRIGLVALVLNCRRMTVNGNGNVWL